MGIVHNTLHLIQLLTYAYLTAYIIYYVYFIYGRHVTVQMEKYIFLVFITK